MPTYSFRSDDPCLHSLDVDHGELGRTVERIMSTPAFWDACHPLHMRAVSDVGAAIETIAGTAPISSGGKRLGITFGPDGVVTPPLEMTVATGQQGDEVDIGRRGVAPQA